jgi:hypothetical protein
VKEFANLRFVNEVRRSRLKTRLTRRNRRWPGRMRLGSARISGQGPGVIFGQSRSTLGDKTGSRPDVTCRFDHRFDHTLAPSVEIAYDLGNRGYTGASLQISFKAP